MLEYLPLETVEKVVSYLGGSREAITLGIDNAKSVTLLARLYAEEGADLTEAERDEYATAIRDLESAGYASLGASLANAPDETLYVAYLGPTEEGLDLITGLFSTESGKVVPNALILE